MVINRFRVAVDDPDGSGNPDHMTSFRTDLEIAVATLAQRPGFVSASTGRNVDDPSLWALVTQWENVGAYRRALSSYEVKMSAVPLLSRAIDEPSAFEPLTGELNRNIPR